jgi:hypothetical protein
MGDRENHSISSGQAGKYFDAALLLGSSGDHTGAGEPGVDH